MAIVVLALALTVGGWATGYRLNVQTASVPVPRPDATPEEVVRAYVEAYNHRDLDTMTAIYPSQGSPGRFRAMGTMQDLTIVSSHADTTYGPSRRLWAVQVQLTFTGLQGSDLAYDPGPNGWTYYLDRSGPDRAWRIVDHGNG